MADFVSDAKHLDVLKDKNESFEFELSGVEAWKVAREISEFYHVNILVYDDIKDKLMHGKIEAKNLIQSLNVMSWMLGVEWLYEDGVIYIGGNAEKILSFPSAGLKTDLERFGDKTSVIGDKIVIRGTERDVKQFLIISIMCPILRRTF